MATACFSLMAGCCQTVCADACLEHLLGRQHRVTCEGEQYGKIIQRRLKWQAAVCDLLISARL